MEKSVFDQPQEIDKDFKRFNIPVKWGIVIGIASCILTTINFMYVLQNYILFLVLSFVYIVLTIIFCGVAGAQQRKAMGGYIDIKQAFQAIFVAILVSSLITTIYGIIYTKVIDPGVMDRIKEATLDFMTRMKAPPEKIDETAKNFDAQVADSLKPSILLYSFAKSLVVSSIFGFICAVIVKKKKPLI